MFNALLEHYFKPARGYAADAADGMAEKTAMLERIAILELIGLNFRDAVQIKPMFEMLEIELSEIEKLSSSEKNDLQAALRQSANAIINDQLHQIRQAGDGAVCSLKIHVGESTKPECFPLLSVMLLKVDQDAVEVRINTSDGQLLNRDEDVVGDAFGVTYYYMPMIDYTVVRPGLKQTGK